MTTDGAGEGEKEMVRVIKTEGTEEGKGQVFVGTIKPDGAGSNEEGENSPRADSQIVRAKATE